MDAPNGCRQVADLFVPFVDQEAGCRVAGLPAVADAHLVAIVVPPVPDPCHRPDQFPCQVLRLAARRHQFLKKLIDPFVILRHGLFLRFWFSFLFSLSVCAYYRHVWEIASG